MMASRLLALAVAALAAVLAWLWILPTGQLRTNTWTPPAAVLPELPAPNVPAGLVVPGHSGAGAYFAILDRPLFAPDRRPAPPPDAKPVAPEQDPMAGLTLYGIFSGPQFSGIVARVNDRVRRVRVNESLGEWTVQSVQGREVTFSRGDETRTMQLVRVFAPRAAAPAAQGSAAPTAAAAPPDRTAIQQREQEAARERLRQRNELFRKAGLPPVKE